jgi:hypothetical protein
MEQTKTLALELSYKQTPQYRQWPRNLTSLIFVQHSHPGSDKV